MCKLIAINNTELPAPVKYDVGLQDIVKGGRVTTGDMVFDVVAVKRKIELDFTMLDSEETSRMLKLIAPPYFQVTYQDPEENGLRTGTFYKGDRKAVGLTVKNGKVVWKSVIYNIIEK